MTRQFEDEIRYRASLDQAVRRKGRASTTTAADWDNTDASNLDWLRSVLSAGTWPKESEIGEQLAQHFFLLVQHADGSPQFQRSALELLIEAVDSGEAAPQQVAWLTDRVATHTGKPQRYATQYAFDSHGEWGLRTTEELAGLQARRRQLHLPPLSEDDLAHLASCSR